MNIGSKWSDIGLTEKEIRNEHDGFYVYYHIHIPTNKILYAGKGNRRRGVSFNRREYYDEYLKGNIEVDIVARFDNEQEALDYEEQEIFYLKYINHCEYNRDEFHEGKRRGNGMKEEVAIDTEVQEIDSLNYSYCNEFDIHKNIKFENIKLHKMELNTIRNSEYRNNVDSFLTNLSNKSYDEVKSMYTFAQQNSKDEDIDLRNAYHFIRKYLKKYFIK